MHAEALDLISILRRVRGNLGILLGGMGAATLLGFGTAALNARAIGAEGLGVLALCQSSAVLMTGLFSFGTQQPMIRLGRQAIEEGRRSDVGLIATVALALDIVAALVAGIAALALIALFAKPVGLPEGYRGLAQFYTIAIFLSGTAASNGIFRLLNRFRYISVAQVMIALAMLLVAGMFYLISAPVSWYLVAHAVILAGGAQAQVALALVLLDRHGAPVQLRASEIRRSGILRPFVDYAWTTNGTSLVNTLRANLDLLLLAAIFGPASAGVYSVVRQITGAINKTSSALSAATFPEISALAARRDLAAAIALRNRLLMSTAGLGAAAIMLVAALGETVLRLGFGEEFATASFVLVLMVVASIIMVAGAMISMFVQAFVSPVRLFLIYLAALGVFLSMVFPSILWLGILGAAITQIGFATILLAGCWISLRKALTPQPH